MISDTAAPRPVVVACLRIGDLHATVDPLTGAVRTERAGLGLSDADAAALEHALRAGERWSAPVAAVTAGTDDVDSVLREVAALGVSVLRVEVGGLGDGMGEQLVTDEHRLAREVAAALLDAFGPPLLVVCGDRSPDRGTGAFPAFLAHELGAAQALGLVALWVADRHDGLLADRRLDAGWRERLRVPLPAVCSVEGAGVRLRRASLEGALATATQAVPVTRRVVATGATMDGERVRVGSTRAFAPRPRVVPAPAAEDPRLRVLALCGALEQRDPPVVVGPVDAPAAADELLSFLDRHGYLEAVDVEVSQGEDGMTRFSDMAWPKAAAVAERGWILLLPVGATEQHGPHLPLTTDTDLAVAVADGAASLAPRAVVAPPLAFGSSGEHDDFAGTLSMGAAATEHVLVELGRSASRHFDRLVMVSTHGGNLDALARAVDVLRSEGRSTVAWVPPWAGDLHAGRTETSLMLAVAPDRVDMAAAVPGDRRPASSLMPLLRRHGVRAVSASGVLGDPTGANAPEGRRLLEEAARDLAATLAGAGRATPAGVRPR